MPVLTGPLLKQMIKEAYDRIDQKKNYLNDLNVFPVPDGDTGINMAITMGKVVEELESIDNDQDLTIKRAAKAIAKGAFTGAKGNSGVILSQFFVGFAKTVEDEQEITTEIFADALIEGSNRAYKAVMNPKEGTILTVVKETAEAAKQKIESGTHDWREVVEHCYEIAQKTTADTPNLLQELKEAGVIDAGALGFVYLIQGWLFVIANTFEGPRVIDLQAGLESYHNELSVEKAIRDTKYRYCTEALVTDSLLKETDAKSKLAQYGDSLIVIKEENSMKLHIHSNDPKLAIKQFTSFGKLIAAKIDDMHSQTEQTHG